MDTLRRRTLLKVIVLGDSGYTLRLGLSLSVEIFRLKFLLDIADAIENVMRFLI